MKTLLGLLILASCSSPKYKTFSTASNFKTAGNIIKGMTPKDAVKTLGTPMSAYFGEDKKVYYVVYPMGDKQVGMTDVMFNDRLECFTFNFEKENDYKYDGWGSDVSHTCQGAIKGQKLDMSLIEGK